MRIPEDVFLVLGGGNALGAYQAGAYQALQEHGVEPGWIAGASIGALNGAIIAGNEPERRVPQLREFWRLAEQFGKSDPSAPAGAAGSRIGRRAAALQTLASGRPGLFMPRILEQLTPLGLAFGENVSLFDTAPLPSTLQAFVDFALLNRATPRLTVTAVDVETGELVTFDTREGGIGPEALRASAAFPVAYPPVEVGGRVLVDPGLSANLPLRTVLGEPPQRPALCLSIDLFDAGGARPRTLGAAVHRAQDLMFASQSRQTIAGLLREYRLRAEGQAGRREEEQPADVLLVHLAYADQDREVAGKMLDYSQRSIGMRWQAGYEDLRRALAALEAAGPLGAGRGLSAYRLDADGLAPLEP